MVKLLAILIGLVLVVVGSIVLTYDSITLTAQQKQVLSVGPLQASTESAQRTIPLPTVLGGAVVVAGVAMVFMGAYMGRRRKQVPAPPAEQT